MTQNKFKILMSESEEFQWFDECCTDMCMLEDVAGFGIVWVVLCGLQVR